MNKVISFSLWGSQSKYGEGAIANAYLAHEIYPGWLPIFYLDQSVPTKTVERLKEAGAAIRIEEKLQPCLRRFLAYENPATDAVIFRDCDSRLSVREKTMVDEWLVSKKTFHIIRDHPGHAPVPYPILAGLFGIRRKQGQDIRMRNAMESMCAGHKNEYGLDQAFLMGLFWDDILHTGDVVIHEDLHLKKEFIGSVFNEHNENIEWSPPVWD